VHRPILATVPPWAASETVSRGVLLCSSIPPDRRPLSSPPSASPLSPLLQKFPICAVELQRRAAFVGGLVFFNKLTWPGKLTFLNRFQCKLVE
jgi:hypothetical protein